MSTDPQRWRERVAVGALVFAVATPVSYALQRIWESVHGESEDSPSLILGLLSIPYFSRAFVAAILGGAVAFLAHALVSRGRDPARAARVVAVIGGLLLPLAYIAMWSVP